jgi:hypothetical protein
MEIYALILVILLCLSYLVSTSRNSAWCGLCHDPQAMGVALSWDFRVTGHHTLCCSSSQLLQLFSGYTIRPSPSPWPLLVAIYHSHSVARCPETPWAMLVPCYSSPQSRSISNPAWQQMPAASKQFLEPEHLTSHGLGLILLWFSGNRFALAKDGKATNHHASHCLSSPLLKLFSGSTSDPLPLHDHLLWPSPSQTLWPGVPRLPKLLLFLFSSPGIAQS